MIRIVLVAVAALATVAVLNADRGVPLALLILFGFLLFFSFLTTRTRFGRHLYAVGGNAEAARRAGIHVDRVRVVVFMLASSDGRGGRDHARLAAAGREPVLRARATCCCWRSPDR